MKEYGICYRDMDENSRCCIPMPIRKIGDRGFDGCTTLGRVSVPSSVTEIGRNAIGDWSNLVLAVRGEIKADSFEPLNATVRWTVARQVGPRRLLKILSARKKL